MERSRNLAGIYAGFKKWKKYECASDVGSDEEYLRLFFEYLYDRPWYDEDLQIIKDDILNQRGS